MLVRVVELVDKVVQLLLVPLLNLPLMVAVVVRVVQLLALQPEVVVVVELAQLV